MGRRGRLPHEAPCVSSTGAPQNAHCMPPFWRVSVVLSTRHRGTPARSSHALAGSDALARGRTSRGQARGKACARLFFQKPARSRALAPAPAPAQAFEERTRAAAPKPIERRKVEAKLKEYVRETVRAAHLKRGGVL